MLPVLNHAVIDVKGAPIATCALDRPLICRKKYGQGRVVHTKNRPFLPETMGLVKDGVIQGLIDQSTKLQGRDVVIRLYNYIVGGVVPPYGKLLLDTPIATPENIGNYMPD